MAATSLRLFTLWPSMLYMLSVRSPWAGVFVIAVHTALVVTWIKGVRT